MSHPEDDENIPEIIHPHPILANVLLPHQRQGVQAMYEYVKAGHGGILAHSMGLGKTLQVICLLQALLEHKSFGITFVLIVVPHNVIENWYAEFEFWLTGQRDEDNDKVDLRTFHYAKLNAHRKAGTRLQLFQNLEKNCDNLPYVVLVSYELYRELCLKGNPDFDIRLKNPGPDLIICDEGHRIKNHATLIYDTLLELQTLRRIVLTGTPFQNNIMELYDMVNFVFPNFLGDMKRFKRRFDVSIRKGILREADDQVVKAMNKNCFDLGVLLEPIIHIRNLRIGSLSAKTDIVLKIRLTPLQIKLYEAYLDFLKSKPAKYQKLFRAFYALLNIGAHPHTLLLKYDDESVTHELESIVEDDSYDEDDDEGDFDAEEVASVLSDSCETTETDYFPMITERDKQRKKHNRNNLIDGPESYLAEFNWNRMVKNVDKLNIQHSNKLILLMQIIKDSEAVGDKVLVFSQSLKTLDLIEEYLKDLDDNGEWFSDGHANDNPYYKESEWGWKKGKDFYKVRGEVSSTHRYDIQVTFNDAQNPRGRVLLISVKAGNLGSNLIGGNRVVLFDIAWNPVNDDQSIARVFRIGQRKNVFVYRFVLEGTMEDVIYKRQITKGAVSLNVLHQRRTKRHFREAELNALYSLDYTSYADIESIKTETDKHANNDPILRSLICLHSEKLAQVPFPHKRFFKSSAKDRISRHKRTILLQSLAQAYAVELCIPDRHKENKFPWNIIQRCKDDYQNDYIFKLARNNLNTKFSVPAARQITCIYRAIYELFDLYEDSESSGKFEMKAFVTQQFVNIISSKSIFGTALDKTAFILHLLQTLETTFSQRDATKILYLQVCKEFCTPAFI